MVLGLPGSGKSYFASRLAQKIGADYLNSDQIRKEIFQDTKYSESEKAKVYEVLLKKMQELIGKKKEVVLDATFYKKELRKTFINSVKSKFVFIEVWAKENIIRQRLEKTRQNSDADFEIYQLIKHRWEPLEEPHLKLESTNNNIIEMLNKAVNFLKNEEGSNRLTNFKGGIS